ncbi:MAG TPA: phosphatidate cytidylyltransferase [Candidatus Elarobacter sp.]|nr:phosphatidate cytidylyltransferase [Candidatus Elarobacter sp.]
MKRVLTAAALVPVVLLIVFKAPMWLFALAVAAIALLTMHEYLGIIEAGGVEPVRSLAYMVGILFVFLAWERLGTNPHRFNKILFQLSWAWIPLFVLIPVIFGVPLIFRKNLTMGLPAVATSSFGTVYIALSLSLLISLRADPVQAFLVVLLLLSVWGGDIAAYYVGRTIGRHKLAPVVSPNKSWEGAIASVIASVGITAAVLSFRYQIGSFFSQNGTGPTLPLAGDWTFYAPLKSIGLLHVIVLGVLTNVAAQLGDLFESALKRGAGVKDSGTLLPGHGGILDRIDALLFAVPVVWCYAQLTGFLQP